MTTAWGNIGSNLTQAGNRVTKSGSGWNDGNAYFTPTVGSGAKVYFEVKVKSGTNYVMFGVTDASDTYQANHASAQSTSTAVYFHSNSKIWVYDSGLIGTLADPVTITDSDIFGIAFDYDGNEWEVFKNGSSVGTYNVSYGFGGDVTFFTSISNGSAWVEVYANSEDFTYSPPSGFDPLFSNADYYWPFDGTLDATNYITLAGSSFVAAPGPIFYSSEGTGHAGNGGQHVQTHQSTLSATMSPVSTFTASMSASFWIKASDPGTSWDILRVSGITSSSSETENAVMILNKNGSTLTYKHQYGSGSTESHTMTGTINYQTLYHVTLVRDDSAKTVKLYINGSLSDTITYTNSCTNTNSGVTVTIAHGVANCEYDELKIWGNAIDSSTITDESTPDSPTQAVITGHEDTVAYWLMTEAYTDTVTDQVGSYDGTWSGIDATEDQATDILGDGDEVITLSSGYGGFTASTPVAAPQTSNYTFTVFVQFSSLTNAVLMEINGGSTNNTVLEVTSGGVIQVTRNSTTVATASSTVTTGTLYLIAVTEGSTNTTIYVNGIQEEQDTRPGGTGTCTTVEVGSIDSGSHSYSMGHAAFFDQEISAADIIDIYTSAPNTPDDVVDLGLISYWKFDESSGTTLTDDAGSNDLTIAGTYNLSQTSVSTWGTTSAVNFTDAGATVSSSELIDFGTGDFSFFVWIKPSGIGDAERQHIFSSVGSQSAQTVNDLLTLTQLTTEPTTGDGVIAYADGTSWNPGSGEGIYAYYNSTWNKLG